MQKDFKETFENGQIDKEAAYFRQANGEVELEIYVGKNDVVSRKKYFYLRINLMTIVPYSKQLYCISF